MMVHKVAIRAGSPYTVSILAERVRQRIVIRFVSVDEGEAQPFARRVADDALGYNQVIVHLTQPGLKRIGLIFSGFPLLNEGRSYGSRSSDSRGAQICDPTLSTVDCGFAAEVMGRTAVRH